MDCPSCKSSLKSGPVLSYTSLSYEGEGNVLYHTCENKECGVDLVVVYEAKI